MAEDPEGDGLYSLPLEEFTPARDALAARLRSAGDAREAARIKALRKPTSPAWAVNQLARRHREGIEELIDASERVRRAQHELIQGGPAQDVWEGTLAEREIIARLTREAQRILEEAGYGAARGMLDRVSDTLAAAAADADGRTMLRRGILTAEMRRAGFGAILAGPTPRTGPKRGKPKAERAASAKRATGPTPKQVLDAEREAARLAREADRAEADAERAERAAARAEQEVQSLRRRLASAEKEASAAAADAGARRKNATAARRDADRAAERLAKLRGSGRRSS